MERFNDKIMVKSALKIWNDADVAVQIAKEAIRILDAAHSLNPYFFSGYSTRSILGGLFYLIARRNKSPITQRNICGALNTTEVTLRRAVKRWQLNFPSLFEVKYDV